nr:hypothetical protein CFP56_34541 [Quercus suber]
MWKMGSDVRIVDVRDGIFQFKFSMESQLKWVLANGPWSFEDHPLVWGLPFDLLSEEVGRDIGNGLGKVVEVDLKAFSSDQAHFLCVRVELPLEKPLCKGGIIASPEGDKVCIGFKYKRLVGLCFKCGRIGHEARECSFHIDHQHEYPYGEWLKAGFRKTTTSVNSGGRYERTLNGGSVDGSSKGGGVAESIVKAGIDATIDEKLPLDFEAIITKLDQSIQSKPINLNSNSIREQQLMDNSNFYSSLVNIKVMDDDANIRKRDLSGNQVVSCDALSLQGDICEVNASKGNTNPIRGGPKKSGVNIKSESPTLQSPPVAGSDVVIAKAHFNG